MASISGIDVGDAARVAPTAAAVPIRTRRTRSNHRRNSAQRQQHARRGGERIPARCVVEQHEAVDGERSWNEQGALLESLTAPLPHDEECDDCETADHVDRASHRARLDGPNTSQDNRAMAPKPRSLPLAMQLVAPVRVAGDPRAEHQIDRAPSPAHGCVCHRGSAPPARWTARIGMAAASLIFRSAGATVPLPVTSWGRDAVWTAATGGGRS
jgi:hypothetical protein